MGLSPVESDQLCRVQNILNPNPDQNSDPRPAWIPFKALMDFDWVGLGFKIKPNSFSPSYDLTARARCGGDLMAAAWGVHRRGSHGEAPTALEVHGSGSHGEKRGAALEIHGDGDFVDRRRR